jgi:hypothetical protein
MLAYNVAVQHIGLKILKLRLLKQKAVVDSSQPSLMDCA